VRAAHIVSQLVVHQGRVEGVHPKLNVRVHLAACHVRRVSAAAAGQD